MCFTRSLRRFPITAFEAFPMFVWLTMAFSRPFQEHSCMSTSSLHDSLLQAIDGLVCYALSLQAVCKVPQHFRHNKAEAPSSDLHFNYL